MNSLLAVVLVVVPYFLVQAQSNGAFREVKEFDALTYLEKTGYLDDLDERTRHHAPDNVKQALKEFQYMADLPITGRLDAATVKQMKLPRCGVPDVIKPSLRPSFKENITDSFAPLPYKHLGGGKWRNKILTWEIKSVTTDMTRAEIRQTLTEALKMWSDVAILDFRESRGAVEIEFEFVTGKHTQDPWAFDGRSGTLAHAFGPGNGRLSGDVHFDDAESWSLHEHAGHSKTSLLQTATHEIGHALGLDHSNVHGSVMYAYYLGYEENFALHDDDIQGIQSLYGQRRGGVQPTLTPRPTSRPQPTPRPTADYSGAICNKKFDAIIQVNNGFIYAFLGNDNSVYSITSSGARRLGAIGTIFPGAPQSPGAAVYDRYLKRIFIFKGYKYWRYTYTQNQFSLEYGYPKTLPNDFHNIDEAMQRDDHGIYVFIGSIFTRWSERSTAHEFGFPRAIDSYFGSPPPTVDATFHASNGYLYMFHGNHYWRYLTYNRHEVLAPNFPKDNRPFWLGCGRSQGYIVETIFGTPGK